MNVAGSKASEHASQCGHDLTFKDREAKAFVRMLPRSGRFASSVSVSTARSRRSTLALECGPIDWAAADDLFFDGCIETALQYRAKIAQQVTGASLGARVLVDARNVLRANRSDH